LGLACATKKVVTRHAGKAKREKFAAEESFIIGMSGKELYLSHMEQTSDCCGKLLKIFKKWGGIICVNF